MVTSPGYSVRTFVLAVTCCLIAAIAIILTPSRASRAEDPVQGLGALIEAAGLVPWPGKKVPQAFELPDLENKKRSSADFVGKPTVLYIYAEW